MRQSFTIDNLLEYTVQSDITALTLFESDLSFVVNGAARVPFAADSNSAVTLSAPLGVVVSQMKVMGPNECSLLPVMQGHTSVMIQRPNIEDLSNTIDVEMLVASNDGLKVDIPDVFVEPKKPAFFWG